MISYNIQCDISKQ